jgi:hypothetical protein
MAEAAQIAVAQIVAEYHDEVGRAVLRLGIGERSKKKQGDELGSNHFHSRSIQIKD